MKYFITLIIFILSYSVYAQKEAAWNVAKKEITGTVIEKHLDILAADDMEGRETGTRGLKKAAQYITGELKRGDLEPIDEDQNFLQEVKFKRISWRTHEVQVASTEQKLLRNFYALPQYAQYTKLENESVAFLGYGLQNEYQNDYRKYKGQKIGLVFNGIPKNENDEWTHPNMDGNEGNPLEKAILAKKKGIEILLIVDESFKENAGRMNRFILNPQLEMESPESKYNGATLIWVSPKMAQDIMGKGYKKVLKQKRRIQRARRSKSLQLENQMDLELKISTESINSANIAGIIPGNDPELKDEVLVLSAHYDHLGKRGSEVYNGADDNGSGTSSLVALAQAMSKYKQEGGQFRRSVLFLFFTGEEKGLLGSQYYTEHPIIPLENTIADINIDMIGRVDKTHEKDSNYVYVIGSDKLSMDLHNSNEAMNKEYTKLELDYTYNDENDPNRFYYRSDHYNFAKNNIPVIFFFSGVHEDYHLVSDTADKIMFDKTAQIARLAFMTAIDIVNAEKRPQLNDTSK